MTRTKTQKARAKAERKEARTPKTNPPKPKNHRKKKWFIGVDNFRMGSGDPPKRARARNGGLDMVGVAPTELGTSSRRQNRGQIFEQDEFVVMLTGSVSFAMTAIQLQPGIANFYPWLAQIAPLYQKYRILKWEYYYKPIVSEYDDIGKRGKVIMSFDSDVNGQVLSTFQQAEAMQPHVDFMPYQKASLELSGKLYSQTQTGLFVRAGPVPAGSDPKTYDAGVLYCCTQGMSGAGTMGELHCRYTVEMYNPILPNLVNAPLNYKWSTASQGSKVMTSGVWTMFDNWTIGGNGLQLVYNNGSWTLPAGIFRISYSAVFGNGASGMTIAFVEVRINGIAGRGTKAGNQLGGGAVVINGEYNGQIVIQAVGGEVITIFGFCTFVSGVTTSDMGLQITSV